VLFKVVETAYDIIPKKLLKRLIELLESFKLVAIWHYLVIGLAVAASLLLIYLFQKKLFSRDKLLERRIQRNQCQECGKQLPPAARACPFCGFVQWKRCGQCNAPTPVYGSYCRECGSALS
jgi:ribosomal protein L40E